MAVILFGPTVIEVRGTIAGTTFSANRNGAYARAWSSAANPRTAYQSRSRGHLAIAANAWTTITPAQRSDWDDFAETPPETITDRFGNPQLLSGLQWFIKINARRINFEQAIISDPPAAVAVLAPSIDEIRVRSFGSPDYLTYFQLAAPIGSTPEFCEASLSLYPRAGLQTQYRGYRQIVRQATPAERLITFGTAFEARFGAYQDGWLAFVRIQYQSDDGIRSVPVTRRIAIPDALEFDTEQTLNGTFEDPWATAAPPNWTLTTVDHVTTEQETIDVYAGSGSCRILRGSETGLTTALISKYSNTTAGRLYRLQFALKVIETSLISVRIQYVGASYTQHFENLTPANWTDYELIFEAPAGSTETRIQFLFPNAGNIDVLLDAVSLREVV